MQQQELSLPRCCSRRCEAGTQKRVIHRLCEVMSITEESAGSDGQTVGSYCRRRLLCFEEQGSDKTTLPCCTSLGSPAAAVLSCPDAPGEFVLSSCPPSTPQSFLFVLFFVLISA